ncbi:MAG: hypothetical protein LRZ92_01980 [Methanosarcinaceae archaeon]|nr:hypothetical protein [Methanosarcinaceae archaeon]
MRIKVYIKMIGQGVLRFDYQYALASALYKKLAVGNIRLASEIHAKKGFKHYNFS